MTPEPDVIAELRGLFKAGATPSRLMRHILEHHGPDQTTDRLIRAYFREAFCVPMFRASVSLLTPGLEGLPIAGVNGSVIHRMVQMRGEWDHNPKDNGHPTPSWMGSLVATDEGKMIEQSDPESSPELSGAWKSLDPSTQQYIKRLMGNSQTLYEKVIILSTLVEQLQQQVIALESATVG